MIAFDLPGAVDVDMMDDGKLSTNWLTLMLSRTLALWPTITVVVIQAGGRSQGKEEGKSYPL
jgi:hypothetical protein